MSRTLRIVGIGLGRPEHLTGEAVVALRSSALLVVDVPRGGDPLAVVRDELLRHHLDAVPTVIEVPEPDADADEDRVAALARAYEALLLEHDGDVSFLVWGDPAVQDSTIRAVGKLRSGGAVDADWEVVPGVSSLQVLAARHRVALHDPGRPLVVTTGSRLHEARDSGAESIVVMLSSTIDLEGFEDWDIWWGANLGTGHERLVSGRVVEVAVDVLAARIDVRTRVGWILDVYLLRKRPAFTAPS